MIKDLSFDLLSILNQVKVDKYGRVSAFLALNKPVGITSHDLVDQVRKKLGTRRVGHVGALDPFASGVMLILVGKKYTRLSNDLMNLDKSYLVDILFGLTTDTLDTEGKILGFSNISNLREDEIKNAIQSLEGGYEQYVPVYSSVKVGGKKLRILARESESYDIVSKKGTKVVKFFGCKGKDEHEIVLPKRSVIIENIQIKGSGSMKHQELIKLLNQTELDQIKEKEYPYITLEFDCSKGFYVRQLGFDLGEKIRQKALLTKLTRLRIGSIKLEDCIKIDDLNVV